MLNPTGLALPPAARSLVDRAVVELAAREGLYDPDLRLYIGFLGRGNPLNFLQTKAGELMGTLDALRKAGEL